MSKNLYIKPNETQTPNRWSLRLQNKCWTTVHPLSLKHVKTFEHQGYLVMNVSLFMQMQAAIQCAVHISGHCIKTLRNAIHCLIKLSWLRAWGIGFWAQQPKPCKITVSKFGFDDYGLKAWVFCTMPWLVPWILMLWAVIAKKWKIELWILLKETCCTNSIYSNSMGSTPSSMSSAGSGASGPISASSCGGSGGAIWSSPAWCLSNFLRLSMDGNSRAQASHYILM